MAGVSFYSIREIRRSRALITDNLPSLDDFIFQKDGEWKMDERIVKVFDMLGSRIAQSMRMNLLQGMGADAKNVKAVDKAIGLDFMDSSGIGGILDLLGMSNTKMQLAKNPKTLQLIMQRIAPMLQNMKLGQNNPGQSGGI